MKAIPVMLEKNVLTPLDLLRAAVLSVMFAPMMIRIGSNLSDSPFRDLLGPKSWTFENEPLIGLHRLR